MPACPDVECKGACVPPDPDGPPPRLLSRRIHEPSSWQYRSSSSRFHFSKADFRNRPRRSQSLPLTDTNENTCQSSKKTRIAVTDKGFVSFGGASYGCLAKLYAFDAAHSNHEQSCRGQRKTGGRHESQVELACPVHDPSSHRGRQYA